MLAELKGHRFATTYGEQMLGNLTERVFNALRDEKTPPIPFDHPWSDADEPTVTPEEAADLHAQLIARSALARLPDPTPDD